jgi:hypothetical protein
MKSVSVKEDIFSLKSIVFMSAFLIFLLFAFSFYLAFVINENAKEVNALKSCVNVLGIIDHNVLVLTEKQINQEEKLDLLIKHLNLKVVKVETSYVYLKDVLSFSTEKYKVFFVPDTMTGSIKN